MQDWLTRGIEALDGNLPGRAIEITAAPAEVLRRDDIGLCLASGVAVSMGGTPIGFIRGARLAVLLAEAMETNERDARHAREASRRLERERHMLAAGLGHELRTPLNAISGYSELVALGIENGCTVLAAEQNAIIWEAAQSLLVTIDSMLDVAGIEAGTVRLDDHGFALRPLAETVVRMLSTLAAERQSALRVDMPDDLPMIVADARMVRQILVNLVANAIRHGGDGCTIVIAARIDRRDRMVIEVRDSGPGMSAAAIARAMRRIDISQRPGTSRGGLGLPLVRALADLHDAHFQLLSTPATGTRAMLTMPEGRVSVARTGRQEAFAFQRPAALFR